MHCLKRAFQNQPSESFLFPLRPLMLQPGLKRVHGSLAIQDSTRYIGKQEEDRGEASGGASVALCSSRISALSPQKYGFCDIIPPKIHVVQQRSSSSAIFSQTALMVE
jgi:hypothetical protein